MKALVIYESMYGNTRAIAGAIGLGLATGAEATVHQVAEVRASELPDFDLLIVGGPTHTWSMSRPTTRKGAADAAAKPGSGLVLEPGATGPGLREWLQSPEFAAVSRTAHVTTFDTRMRAPLGLSGAASRAIARRLGRLGISCSSRPQSFYVTKQNQLVDGEAARAEAWGRELASTPARTS